MNTAVILCYSNSKPSFFPQQPTRTQQCPPFALLQYYYLNNTKLDKRNETQFIWVWKWWIGGLIGTYKVPFLYVVQHDNIVDVHFLLVLFQNMSCNARHIIKRKKNCRERETAERKLYVVLGLMLLYGMPLRYWF